MVNCIYSGINEHDFLTAVIAEKKQKYQQILNPICNRVERAYDLYLDDFHALCAKPGSEFTLAEEPQRLALQKCYSIGTRTFKLFKREFFSQQPVAIQDLCPYCMINSPDTLDHYVGQQEFPEFSILTKNLIPCCWKCNHRKNDSWRERGTRKYINYYDDQFLRHRFLTAELVLLPGTNIPSVTYAPFQPLEIDDEQYALILSHFSSLELIDKYERKANNRVSTEIETTQLLINIGWDDEQIIDFLMRKYQSLSSRFGVNYWEGLIYMAISNHLDIIRNL